MQDLLNQLEELITNLSFRQQKLLRNRLSNLTSVYPFNESEFIISHLLSLKTITLNDYILIRDEYIANNIYLHVFEISAPRKFGETWAQAQIKTLAPELEKPTKKLDNIYSGEYDFFYTNLDKGPIKIEVKASRAVSFKGEEPLYVRALASDSTMKFDMNFQQIKTKCCDVFVWVGVWRDVVKYWVLSSNEVATSKYYSKGQHRGNTGEGQLHLTNDNMLEFIKFESKPNELLEKIIGAAKRNLNQKNI